MRFILRILSAIYLTIALSSSLALAQISSPDDISGLVFWVDGKDVNGTGVQPANGSTITTWTNKGSAGSNLTTQTGTVTFEAAGFDGINPSLRFPLTARMAAANPFAATSQNELTVFYVLANVTQTRNFAVSLNGLVITEIGVNTRTSFHAPWVDDNVYFDVAGTGGSSRVLGFYPNALTETSLFTGLNDEPGNRQWLRVDGQDVATDMSGHNARVGGGIHIGALSGTRPFDGRFGEVVIYDRALSLDEVQDVECFLLLKWKLPAAPAGCAVSVSAEKSVEVWDPASAGLYAIPGNDVIYTIAVTHESGPSLDSETVFLADSLPPDVMFYNGDIDDAGPETHPVKFVDNGSGLTFDYPADVGYFNGAAQPSDMAGCNYAPSPGYDPNVTFICIQPSGIFQSGTPDPSFSVSFRTRIN